LKVEHLIENNNAIITIHGNINLYELHFIKDVFEIIRLNTDIKKIILDLKDVEFIDSSGIGLLIVQANKSKQNDEIFVLANLSRSVDQVMRVASIKKLFYKADSIEEALKIE
jgi:stage II sporulation protein AA (anti-sigma F factor antagonist)